MPRRCRRAPGGQARSNSFVERAREMAQAYASLGARVTVSGAVAVKSGTKKLCTATLSNGTGSCTLAATALKPGSSLLTAVYTATAHFGASTSSPATLTVTKDPTSTALSLSAPSVAYGKEQTEILKATVTAGGGITPTGSLKIKAGTRRWRGRASAR
jgi:hypothetical protein